MKVRYLRGLALVAVGALVFSGASALASPKASTPKAPAANLTFKNGPDSQFNIGGGTRFSGYYDKSTKRVYFLGMRNGDDSTSGGSNGQGCGATKKICALPATILPARGSRRFIADPSGSPTPTSVGAEQHHGERGRHRRARSLPYPYPLCERR